MTDRIRFITYLGQTILLGDLSQCNPATVEKVLRELPEVVSTQPRGSVLVFTDFRAAQFDAEGLRVMKETAVFDKPYVKRAAWIGAESFPPGFPEELHKFSRRDFGSFESRKMPWHGWRRIRGFAPSDGSSIAKTAVAAVMPGLGQSITEVGCKMLSSLKGTACSAD